MTELPKPGVSGVCPYCGHDVVFLHTFHVSQERPIECNYSEPQGIYRIVGSSCPNSKCRKIILVRQRINMETSPHSWEDDIMIWPQGITRKAPPEVPKEIAKEYEEAYAILNRSETATALLARRCLQHIIHDAAKQHDQHLDKEIKAIKDSLPDDLKEKPTLIRLLGKIAAHPKEDSQTGEILAVEKNEAEFALTIIEYLFEHYYVKPAKEKELTDQIRAKAAKAGEKPKDKKK